MLHLHSFNKARGEEALERAAYLAHGLNQLAAQLLAYLIVLWQRDQIEFLASVQAMIVQLLAVNYVPVCKGGWHKQR